MRWTTKPDKARIRVICDAGFDAETVVLAGFGLAGEHEKDWLMRREALKVSAAMFPEYVGLRCLDGVIKLYDGQTGSAARCHSDRADDGGNARKILSEKRRRMDAGF